MFFNLTPEKIPKYTILRTKIRNLPYLLFSSDEEKWMTINLIELMAHEFP